MGKPKAPPAPDYIGAAQATAAGNKEAAIASQVGNMVNQVTPQGTVTYNKIGEEQGVPRWQQTVVMSPEQQAIYNADIAMNRQLQGIAGQGLGYVQGSLTAPLQGPNLQTSMTGAGQLQTGVAQPTVGAVSGVNRGAIQGSVAPNIGQMQTSIQNPSLVQQDVTDALYAQQTRMLDPQFARQQSAIETQLANQGITRGSEAWNQSMTDLANQKQQAYESARASSIGQGVAAGSQMFQNQLAGKQFANQAIGQQFQQTIQAGGFQNEAQAQDFLQGVQNATMQNQTRQQQLQEALSTGQFANAAQQQQFSQQLAELQAENQSLQQQFSIAQALRQDPVNTLNSLRSSAQMTAYQAPQASVSQPGQLGQWAGPDVLGATTALGSYNQGIYNAKSAANSAITSGLFSLGSAAVGAPPGTFSDRSVKQNIAKIGMMDNGLPIYSFEYKPEYKDEAGHGLQVGHMADEVEAIFPSAVIENDRGIKMVNYGVIYGGD
jgi:hypothetical protein